MHSGRFCMHAHKHKNRWFRENGIAPWVTLAREKQTANLVLKKTYGAKTETLKKCTAEFGDVDKKCFYTAKFGHSSIFSKISNKTWTESSFICNCASDCRKKKSRKGLGTGIKTSESTTNVGVVKNLPLSFSKQAKTDHEGRFPSDARVAYTHMAAAIASEVLVTTWNQ